jgi:uncharacterized protein YjbI with pentapeptide repeats
LHNSNLLNTDLSTATLDRTKIDRHAFGFKTREDITTYIANNSGLLNLEKEQLSGLDLSNLNLAGTNFKNANLKYTDLSNSDLTGVNFEGAHLLGCELKNAILINVIGATFSHSDVGKST